MIAQRLTPLAGSSFIPIVICLMAMPGCRKQDPGFEVVTLDGRIEKIERTSDDTGKITVSYYSKKQEQEITGTGAVTENTEIMINGAIATLRDLREGERIRGEVRIEGKGDRKERIILKIIVDRPRPLGTG